MPPLIKQPVLYTCGDLAIVAYPNKDILASLYLRFKQEKLLAAFFHERDTLPEIDEWLTWCMEPKSLMMCALLRLDQDVWEPIGLAKVGVPKVIATGHSKAEVGMIFVRQYQKRKWTIPACQMMIEYVFDRTELDVLYGTIPEHNHASLRFMMALGFERLKEPIRHYTVWQGEECGAFVSWMAKRRWLDLVVFAV